MHRLAIPYIICEVLGTWRVSTYKDVEFALNLENVTLFYSILFPPIFFMKPFSTAIKML